MGRPWAELSSAERLDAILLAVARIEEHDRFGSGATANAIAGDVGERHMMKMPRSGNHGRGNVSRQMSTATRVTPGITALRNRGLLRFGRRPDGMSGTADRLTEKGAARVRELRETTTRTEGEMPTIEELKQKVQDATGYVDEEPAVVEHDGFTYGERVRVIGDDEDEGVFAGDEGFVIISQLGAAEFGTARVGLHILADGMSAPVEVEADNIEPAD